MFVVCFSELYHFLQQNNYLNSEFQIIIPALNTLEVFPALNTLKKKNPQEVEYSVKRVIFVLPVFVIPVQFFILISYK